MKPTLKLLGPFRGTARLLAIARYPGGGSRSNTFKHHVFRGEADEESERGDPVFQQLHTNRKYSSSYFSTLRGWASTDRPHAVWCVWMVMIIVPIWYLSRLYPEYFVDLPYPFQPMGGLIHHSGCMDTGGHTLGRWNWDDTKGDSHSIKNHGRFNGGRMLEPRQTMLRFDRFNAARELRNAELAEVEAEIAALTK
eukprot:Hpha_TRINITY_DN35224_c0_g1::TRINITY_DN35224_c0_g1_i1::g.145213::m.145213